ncbi:MAG: aspartyl-phosphate phosphatase Spo0E family protein [Tissierellia bacterium]|nr:aspartyl-phosphate phosphatase Spo0E family protein [Tissierellia bacterium]
MKTKRIIYKKIEELKEILKTQITKTGIESKEVLEISQKLDELIVEYMESKN